MTTDGADLQGPIEPHRRPRGMWPEAVGRTRKGVKEVSNVSCIGRRHQAQKHTKPHDASDRPQDDYPSYSPSRNCHADMRTLGTLTISHLSHSHVYTETQADTAFGRVWAQLGLHS